jgi:hypothetical protein
MNDDSLRQSSIPLIERSEFRMEDKEEYYDEEL